MKTPIILVTLLVSSMASAQDYEKPGTIPLRGSAPQALLDGSRGTIGDPVSNDGMFNTYVIISPQGEFKATSVHGLCKLVREVNAIQEIAVLEKTEAFSDSAVEAVKNLGKGAVHIVTDPVETFKAVGAGVADVFRDIGDRMERGSESGEHEDGSMKGLIGFSKVKRNYGYEFGVDVYSNNETLQHYLDQLSWAGFSGSIAFTVAATVATGGLAGAAISATNYTLLLEDIIRDTTPIDLRELTRDQLRKQGFEEDLVNLFIRNEVLSPRNQAFIAGALMVMEGVEGKQYLLRRAANEKTYEEGFDRQVQIQMYVHIHSKTPIARFVDIGNSRVVAQTKEGAMILAATSDHVLWTKNLDGLMQHKNQVIEKLGLEGSRQLWLTGNVSEQAQKGLYELGWGVRPNLINDYVDTLCNPSVAKVSLDG